MANPGVERLPCVHSPQPKDRDLQLVAEVLQDVQELSSAVKRTGRQIMNFINYQDSSDKVFLRFEGFLGLTNYAMESAKRPADLRRSGRVGNEMVNQRMGKRQRRCDGRPRVPFFYCFDILLRDAEKAVLAGVRP